MATKSQQTSKSKTSKLLVAAIDFGTTYSGYAFSFKHDYDKDPIKVSSNSWAAGTRALVSLKAPTTLLLKPDKTFEAFGYEAEDKYGELAEDDLHKNYYFFRRFKMLLFQKSQASGLKRDVQIEDDKGKKMKALTVFSMCIKYLREHLDKTLKNRATGIVDADIQWVLTVPAIWSDGSKQFMREAAEMAGIKKDNLIIALEPEAASLYCMHLPVDKIVGGDQTKSSSDICSFPLGTRYMVVDVGGGTVDITVHEVVADQTLKELSWASGGAWGGTRVDEAFQTLIMKILGDDVSGTQRSVYKAFTQAHTADWVDLYREFETKKRNIKLDKAGKETLKIPVSLSDTYEEVRKKTIKEAINSSKEFKDKVTWTGDKLRIDAGLMRSLFKDSCDNTVKHMRDLFKDKASKGTDTILLVGGFSESPMLQEKIKTAFPDKRLIIPEEAGLAVLKGAVLFGHDPLTIVSRIAKCSYGVRVYRDFQEGIHPQNKKVMVGGKVKCKDVFATHVKKGQELKVGEPQISQRYTPLEADQATLVFDIYTSSEEDAKYVTDVTSMYVGQLEVEVPDLSGGKERGVHVNMVFGGTEITVEATEEKSGKRKTATFNFLQNS